MISNKYILNIDLRFFKSFLFLLLITVIDYLSIGTELFKIEVNSKIDTRYFSSVVFIATAFIAQVVYSTFSSITTGLTASIVFEASTITKKIATDVFISLSKNKSSVNPSDLFLNIYVCICIGTLLFALCSLLCYYYKLGEMFKNIPLLSIFVIMASLGLSLFSEIFKLPTIINLSNNYNLIYKFVIAGLGFSLYFLEIFLPNFSLLIPIFLSFFVLCFNLFFRFYLNYNTNDLSKCGWIASKTINENKYIWDALKLFKGATLSWKTIFFNFGNIFEMVFLNLIYININLLPYSYVIGKSIDLNKEWCCQAIGNFFAAFTGYPSYFVSSSSIMFYRSGAYSRYISLFGSFAPLLLAFIFTYISDYTPFAVSTIMLVYLGILFINSYFISYIFILSLQDLSILIFGIISSIFIGPQAAFAIVVAISAIIILHYQYPIITESYITNQTYEVLDSEQINNELSNYLQEAISSGQTKNKISDDKIEFKSSEQIKNKIYNKKDEIESLEKIKNNVKDEIEEIESLEETKNNIIDCIQDKKSLIQKDINCIKDLNSIKTISIEIDYILFFMTINRLKKDLSLLKDNSIINFTKCPYIDINANIFLLDHVKYYKNITFLGIPKNLYYNAFKKMENINLIQTKSLI